MNEISIIIPENFVTDEVNEFKRRIINLIDNGEKKFTIDFSKCNSIDSNGLKVLRLIHKKCMKLNGRFKIVAVNNPNVMRTFKLTRLNRIFEIRNK